MSVEEQIVTGQSGAPVVKLIQDSVVVCFWLCQRDPITHLPLILPHSQWCQIAADFNLPSIHDSIHQLRQRWQQFSVRNPNHPLVRLLLATNTDYCMTGYAILSLCLPITCTFLGTMPSTQGLLCKYCRLRYFPVSYIPLDIQNGLFLGGLPTSDSLTGLRGLLNFIYQNHSSREALQTISHIQRLTTSVSIYAYNPSIGIDDCLLSTTTQEVLRDQLESHITRFNTQDNKSTNNVTLPYRMESDIMSDSVVGKFITLCASTQQNVIQSFLAMRSKAPHGTPSSSNRTNQIALLCMLGTKGSVSNAVQCSHTLGQICKHRMSRVYKASADYPGQSIAADRLR